MTEAEFLLLKVGQVVCHDYHDSLIYVIVTWPYHNGDMPCAAVKATGLYASHQPGFRWDVHYDEAYDCQVIE